MTGSPELVIGLDCSTHGAKAVAWDPTGLAVLQATVAYPLLSPQPGFYEQNALDWADAAIQALSSVGHQAAGRVRAIALTHQRETFVPVDSAGAPLRNAIVWMDERAWQQVGHIRQVLGDERFHRITGKPLSLTPSISKILWLREHEPDTFSRAHRWLDVAAFVVRRLTGADVTSIGSADPMGLVDLAAGVWSQELLDLCGLAPDSVPSLLPCGTPAARLLPELAARTGLDPSTPVILTAGDGQVAAVGSQVLDLDRAYLNLGTAIVSGTVASELLVDRAFRTMSGALPGTFLLESDLKGGGFTIDWLCQTLLGGALAPAELERQAAAIAPGSDALVLVPYFATVMNPYWDDDATGILVGLRGSHAPAHLFRAILEGIALEQRLHLREIERAAHHRIAGVHATGGGAASDLWCAILANALDRPVSRTSTSEATSLGAAMIASASMGTHASVRDAAACMGRCDRTFQPGSDAPRYARLFDEVYVGLYPCLREALARLAAFARSSSS